MVALWPLVFRVGGARLQSLLLRETLSALVIDAIAIKEEHPLIHLEIFDVEL